MTYQETEGLLSPQIRNIRLSKVAEKIEKESNVLDLACGAGYLASYLPEGCQYFGVDRILMPNDREKSTSFLNLDLLEKGATDVISEKLPMKMDYIVCVAFLEHIPSPTNFLSKHKAHLTKGGVIVGTTPHPRGRIVHEILSSLSILSREAAHEHEDFLGKKKIEEMALGSGGHLVTYETFLFGMNQLFVIEYP